MAKTNNNSLKLQRAVRSLFYDYQEKKGCLGTTYAQAACGCDNALQMWRGPKGEKGDPGPQGPKGDNAGSFLVDAEFVVDPEGQEPGAYLKLVLIDVAQQEQVVYVDLSELEDVYSAGNGIDITSMVIAAKLGAGLTFDQQGNITSAYQFCDGLDETSNVVKVKLDASNNILGFAGSGCKGLTATVNLTQAASGVALVLTGASGTVLNTIPLEGGTGITVQKNAQTGGFTWLVDFNGVISSTAGNNLTISDNKLYVGNSTLSYTVGDGVFTLTNPAGGTSSVTLPTVVRSLDRADLVCEGENAPYLRLTFKRDNGQNLYQDVSLACLASALDVISDVSIDVQCDTSRDLEPIFLAQYYGSAQAGLITQEEYEQWLQNTSYSPSVMAGDQNHLLDTSSLHLSCDVEYEGDPPVAYAAYVELVSNNDSFWFAPNPDVTEFSSWSVYVPLSTLLAAGDEGYRLVPVATTDPDYDGDGTSANIPDRTIRVVTTVDTSGAVPEYTITYYWDNGVSDKPITDLVITNAGGDETRVDLNPALTHVGGNVLTVADTADRELVVLHTFNDLPRTESGAPNGYAMSMNVYPNANVCDNSNQLTYLSHSASDGVYTLYVESGTITHFAVSIDEYVPVPGGTQYDYSWNRFETYVEIDHANNNACIDVDNCTSVADLTTTGVVIYGHDTQGKRLEELSLYLTGELVEDGQGHPGLAIRAYRQGAKKVLRLGPSCSSDIPLADIGGIAGIETDVRCDTAPGESTPFEYYLFGSTIATLALGDDGTIEGTLGSYQFTDTPPYVSQNFFTLTIPVSPDSTTTGFALDLDARSHNNNDGDTKSFVSPPYDATKCTSVAEYIAAGATGLPLDYVVTRNEPDSGVAPFGPDEQLYMAVTYNGNDSYTFTFTVRTPDETTLTTDLVVTNSDGTEQRVDMKPLLAHIGGTVQDMPVGEATPIPVLGTLGAVQPSIAEPGFYVESDDYMIYIVDMSGITGISYEATIAEGKVTVCTSEQIKSIRVAFPYFDNPNTDPQYLYFLVADLVTGAPYDMQDILDAGDEGVELLASSGTAIPPVLAPGAPPVRIRATYTHVSDDEEPGDGEIRGALRAVAYPDCYTFELFGQEIATRLCLAPSCDPCIDLTPAVADCVTSVNGTVDCGGNCFPWPTDKRLGCTVDFYDANNNHLDQSSCTVYDCTITGLTIPTGAVTVHGSLYETYGISHSWSFSLPLTEGATVIAIAKAYMVD